MVRERGNRVTIVDGSIMHFQCFNKEWQVWQKLWFRTLLPFKPTSFHYVKATQGMKKYSTTCYAAPSNPPQSSIMNVLNRRQVQMLCLIPVNGIQAWNVLLYNTRKDNVCRELQHWLWLKDSFFFNFPNLLLTFPYYNMLIYKYM